MYFTLAQRRVLAAHFGKKSHPCASRNPPAWCNKKKRKSSKRSTAAQKRTRKQAAQAMRIHQREGVSLKTAWRRVKSKRSTTRRRTTKRAGYGTRKRNTLASRAMKMAHRDGISLKTAWRRVKGSGYGAKTIRRRRPRFG